MTELLDEERQPCEIWTRVCGYHRPVNRFNVGKKKEFEDMKKYEEPSAVVLGAELQILCDGQPSNE